MTQKAELSRDAGLSSPAQTHKELWTQNCPHGPKCPGFLPLRWPIVKCGPYRKGMILDKAAFCGWGSAWRGHGWRLSVSSVPGSWAIHLSLKRVVGSVSPSLGCWGDTIRTESNLLCRFLGNFINILRSAVIAEGKLKEKPPQRCGPAEPLSRVEQPSQCPADSWPSYNKPWSLHLMRWRNKITNGICSP